jgi:phage terminase large subunit-like protein
VAIQTDGDNIKPSKKRSHERIDGIVSLCMALGLYDTATAPAPEQSWDIISL